MGVFLHQIAGAKEYADSGVGIFNFSPGLVITDMLTRFDVIEGHVDTG